MPRRLKMLLPFACTLVVLAISASPTFARTYTSQFGLTENPLTESSNWSDGLADGLTFSNVRTTPGLAFGTQPGTLAAPQQYADSTAVVNGAWLSSQTASAVVVNTLSSSNLGIAAEVELRVNTTITPNSITGYECLFSVRPLGESPPGRYMQIVRWNGPLANFTFLDGRDIGSTLQTGDVVTCRRVGASIQATVTRNGAVLQTFSVSDSTYTAGGPGVGFYLENASGFNNQYGFSSFVATDHTLLTAATCNRADVQTQVTAAQDGDLIVLPPGSCTWTPGITVTNKALRVHGSGQGTTNIALSGGTTFLNFTGTSAGGFVGEIDSMTISGAGNANGWITINSTYPFRIHHLTIPATNTANRDIFITGSYGLIDHLTYTKSNGSNAIQILGSQFTPSGRWAQAMDYASINQVFIEDNTFTSTNCNTGLGVFDGFNGSKMHFRHNTVANQQSYTHGYDTASESSLWTLITNNAYDMARDPCAIDRMIFIRGGTGLVQNNTFHQTQPNNAFNPSFLTLAYFRSSLSQQGSICGDNSANSLAVDLYTGTPTGYPCFEQTGFGAPWPTASPWYECNNTGTGTRPANQNMTSESIHVVAGREYFNDVCKPGFVEFTYPHPYQSTSGGSSTPSSDITAPSTPTNLRVTSFGFNRINLAWDASTDDTAVTGYLVERVSGVVCAGFAQIGTTASLAYNDIGMLTNTPYCYRVRATDAANNLSGYSSNVSQSTDTVKFHPTLNLRRIVYGYLSQEGSYEDPRTHPFLARMH